MYKNQFYHKIEHNNIHNIEYTPYYMSSIENIVQSIIDKESILINILIL